MKTLKTVPSKWMQMAYKEQITGLFWEKKTDQTKTQKHPTPIKNQTRTTRNKYQPPNIPDLCRVPFHPAALAYSPSSWGILWDQLIFAAAFWELANGKGVRGMTHTTTAAVAGPSAGPQQAGAERCRRNSGDRMLFWYRSGFLSSSSLGDFSLDPLCQWLLWFRRACENFMLQGIRQLTVDRG